MNKDLTDQELIELAKKAKPVPVEEDKPKKMGAPKKKRIFSALSDFMAATGLKPGRNEADKVLIYEAYCEWADNPATRNAFYLEMNKYFKKSSEPYYKLNMMPITLMEIVKEIKNGKNETSKS
jgi:hypothetical protein